MKKATKIVFINDTKKADNFSLLNSITNTIESLAVVNPVFDIRIIKNQGLEELSKEFVSKYIVEKDEKDAIEKSDYIVVMYDEDPSKLENIFLEFMEDSEKTIIPAKVQNLIIGGFSK